MTEQPSESELAQLYDDGSWQVPEQVIAEYVLLPRDFDLDLDVVDDAEVRDAYDRYVEGLNTAQETRASHILFTGDDATDQAQAALTRLNAGESFEDLARELSQDPLSGEQGGDLGFAPAGTYVPEFEQALNELSVDEVSQPVETQFGTHLIKLTEARDTQPDSFEQQAPRLRAQLAEQAARLEFEANAEEIANIAFAGDLEEIADTFGLPIETTSAFSRDQGEGIASAIGIRVAAFNDEVLEQGENSSLLETDDGILVLRVKERIAPRQRSLDEVRDELVTAWQQNRRATLAAEQAEAQLSGLVSLEAMTINRAGNVGVPQALVNRLYGVPRGSQEVVQLDNGDAYAVQVVEVTAGDREAIDESITDFLAGQSARQSLES